MTITTQMLVTRFNVTLNAKPDAHTPEQIQSYWDLLDTWAAEVAPSRPNRPHKIVETRAWGHRVAADIKVGSILDRGYKSAGIIEVSEVVEVSDKTVRLIGYDLKTGKKYSEMRRKNKLLIYYSRNNVVSR